MHLHLLRDLLRRGRLALCLLLALLVRPPAARAYNCFYEMNATYRLGGLQQRLAGHVDASTGEYLDTFTFGVLPNAGMPITAGILYNSGEASVGPFAGQTSCPQDWFIVGPPTTGEYTLVGPENVQYGFNSYNSSTNQYTDTYDPFLLGASMVINTWHDPFTGNTEITSYTLTWQGGDTWTFDSSGGLIRMVDGYGNGVSITRDSTTGYATQVAPINGSGYVAYDLSSDSHPRVRQVRIVYPGGTKTWSVAYYSSTGPLYSITAPDGGVWTYVYGPVYYRPGTWISLAPVQTITDPLGHTAVSLAWDSSGRMTSLTTPATSFSFSYSTSYGSDSSTGTVTAVSARGHSTSVNITLLGIGYIPNSFVDNTLGETTSISYGNLTNYLSTSTTDFRGRVTNFGWDNNTGHLLSRSWTTPAGATATDSFGYDPASGGLTSSTDPLNRTTSYTVNPCACVMSSTTPRGYTTTDTRDQYGNVTSVTNALSQKSTLTFNSNGQWLTTTDPLNHTTTTTYDSYLRPATVQDANGKTVSYTYDSMDRLLTTSQTMNGQTLTTTNVYDLNGNRVKMTDPKGQVWQWTFDAANRVTQATDPLGKSATISYDGDGNISTVVDRAGNTASYTYDTADRLVKKTFTKVGGAPDSTVTYSYNSTTHLLSSIVDTAAPGNQTWSYLYDSLDRATQVSTPYGTINVGLDDKINRRDSVQCGAQGTITYGFDNDDNLVSILQNNQTATLTYDQLDRLTQQSLPATPNPVTTGWSFDAASFVSSVTSSCNGATLDSHTYTRDAVGNITQEVIGGANPSTSTFAYDDLYRLTSATVNGTSYSYVYDQVGNRTSQTAGGVTTNYSFDSADHLTALNGHAVTSDANGNITQDDSGALYSWDVRGRLIGLTKGGSSYAFTYGPDNLRTSKSVNGLLTTYLLDGDQVVTDTINGTAYQNLFGPGTDHPLARNGEFFLPNQLSSTTGLTNGSGTLTQSYLYGPFGESMNTPSDSNPFQYTGRENDGDGLLYYRARYYCPAYGRFISADPLGFGGGINPYVYAGDNPVGLSDPSGEVFGSPEDPDGLMAMGYGQPSSKWIPIGITSVAEKASIIQNEEEAALGANVANTTPTGGYTLHTEPVGSYTPPAAATGGSGGGPYGGLTGTVNADGTVTTYGNGGGGGGGGASGGGSGFGDLTPWEIDQIQTATDQAGRPIYVVGSAASGTRRNPGTGLPLGKGPGTRSDIDYLLPHSSAWYWRPYVNALPDIDSHGPLFGIPNPWMGPALKFEPRN